MSLKSSKFVKLISEKLHVIVVALSVFLVVTSPWILIGSRLRAKASIWDSLHVYLGLVAAVFGLLFLLKNLLNGHWRQFFPWLKLDFSQCVDEIKQLKHGKLPSSGGKGIFSIVEGIGLLLMALVSITGIAWFIVQGTSDALMWRKYHIMFAQGFVGFLAIHIVFAAFHIIDMVRNS
ncbi:cytochrome b/b6 domain-containing protein [Shewanella sp. 10N.7]|uniref:cytochrome b/b6 domain-containing protein n=1 Tax=Shewanella sp. 10N.7 TaxID=2885093 RepID=UPI001E5059C1|nr:cytochrome b/b6 domain-containing protein [Shewanella sp. 10N.7]MCC4832802.1 cytochrome b/b6 domain-containing protein [Shewanella sp. 10N.7]